MPFRVVRTVMKLSTLLAVFLIVTSGCLGATPASGDTTWTPTPNGTVTDAPTTVSLGGTNGTPPPELWKRNEEVMVTGFSHSLSTTWEDEYPNEDYSTWDTNTSTLKLYKLYDYEGYFEIDEVCYWHAKGGGIGYIRGHLVEEVRFEGYEPYTIRKEVAIVPVNVDNPSMWPIAEMVNPTIFKCDVPLVETG